MISDDGERPLNVTSVDILVGENGRAHHTYYYELMERPLPNLVIRRGQPFNLLLKLNRNFNPDTDALSFIFTVSGMLHAR